MFKNPADPTLTDIIALMGFTIAFTGLGLAAGIISEAKLDMDGRYYIKELPGIY